MAKKARKQAKRQRIAKASGSKKRQAYEPKPRMSRAFIVQVSDEMAKARHRPYKPRARKEPELLSQYVKPRYGVIVKEKRYNTYSKT